MTNKPTIGDENRSPVVLVPELFRRSGGVQRYSLRFIESLDRILGIRVPVISMNDLPGDIPADFGEDRVVMTCGSSSPLRRKLNVIKALYRARGCVSIFSTHPNPAPLLAVSARLWRKPFLTVAHGIDAWNPPATLRFGLRRAHLLLPVSQFTASRLQESLSHHLPPVKVLPNMVEAETFFPAVPRTPWRERLGLSESDTLVLTVCRLDRTETGKGYDLILESMPALLARFPNLHWVLGGKGNDLPRLREKANALGVSSHCHFPGFIDDGELPDLYRSADLFILPSRKEGFGIVFLEAAASGLPVIAGNEDGAVDALANGRLGTLIPPRTVSDVTDALEHALSGPAPDPAHQHRLCIELFGREAFDCQLSTILKEHPALLARS